MKKRFHFFGMIWSGSIIQDHSDLSASKEAINPFLQWVYRLLWCTMIRKGWWLRFVFRWPYANKFPTHMVRMFCSGKLRMRKQNAKTTVPLDVVPERRTKRCSPRFRPGGRFCELSFRYQSSPTGREGEISRPLDHMRHIPLIHSARFKCSTNCYIYTTVFQVYRPNGTGKCVLVRCIWPLHMRLPQKYVSQGLEPLLTSFWLPLRYVLLRIGTRYIQFTHAHLFNKRKSSIFSCLFNLTSSKAKINGQKSHEHRARMIRLFRIKQLIN